MGLRFMIFSFQVWLLTRWKQSGTNMADLREMDSRSCREMSFVTVNMLGCHDGIPLLDIKGIVG